MIERGSGQTSGLTNWNSMDVSSMWSCIEDHDTTGHWQQVAGWRKVCDLAQTHLGRLQEYRRGLAEAWPPATNAAARAYIAELDQLIDQVQRTHDAAAANYDALAAATRAISSTRTEMKPLFEAYAAKVRQKLAYEEMVADPKAVAGSRLPEAPVTDADLERLNVQARGVMLGLSGELQQAQVMLRQPPPKPWSTVQHDSPDVYGTASTAPIIPPIVAVPIAPPSGTNAINRQAQAARPVPTPTAPRLGPVLGARSTSGQGPVLGAAGAGLAPTQFSPGPSGLTPSTPTTPSSGPGLGLPPNIPPVSGSTGRGSTSGLRGESGPLGRPISDGNTSPRATPRAMPPGGLIGGPPGMGIGQPGAGATPPRRVNPVGGVIGGGGAGTAPTGAAGSRPGAGRASQLGGMHGIPPMGGAPGIGGVAPSRGSGARGMGGIGQGVGGTSGQPERQNREESESRRWDPDHPWETEEGVTPVVRPPDDQGPIDPGPAIGFDR